MRKTSVCTSLAIACALSAARLGGAGPQAPGDATALEPAGLIQRHLARGEEHRYQLPLAAGEFARVIVEQQGIDVIVEVRDPDDHAIDEFQEEIRPFAAEGVDVVARESGTHTLAVRPADGAAHSGDYTIRLDSRRHWTATSGPVR
jgi:hypothetical protein